MNEFTLLEAAEKVDRQILERAWELCLSLLAIKNHHEAIKAIIAKDSKLKLSDEDIESVARLLSVLRLLADGKIGGG